MFTLMRFVVKCNEITAARRRLREITTRIGHVVCVCFFVAAVRRPLMNHSLGQKNSTRVLWTKIHD